ncbi:MAG TPA: GntR family transcriptional regulator [Peptococcaceae bacterium]|jgi:DNA-binding GntR family transcriptional regulator|nr:GntR family transcriptional regulator [Peptococcaceae bacterium]
MKRKKRLETVELDRFKPLRDVVFETLRKAILEGVFPSGERLIEEDLAEELGVSRTPVREAIRRLEQEGFVVIIPRKGAYVSEISFKDVHEVFEIRAALEALACGLAAERATPDEIEQMEQLLLKESAYLNNEDLSLTVEADVGLHELFYAASRNERLINALMNLKDQIYRLRSTSMGQPGRKKKSLEEHKAIVEAIGQRNVSLAQKLGQEHIEYAEQEMLKFLNKKGVIS